MLQYAHGFPFDPTSNCWRSETGRLQQLLYLNPHPTGQPIKDLPIKSSVVRSGAKTPLG
jgi:hypothetical protein